MYNKRDIWVDDVKILSCILVVLGHFFQSMVKAEIIHSNELYKWFTQTIYLFHVYLFFICSGYLYQKYSNVNSVQEWLKNIRKKIIVLGIPYIAFSTITWLLKTVFSGTVNQQVESLFRTLILEPTAPYWFLYVLFFAFLVTPTFGSKNKMMMYLAIAAVMEIFYIEGKTTGIYVVDLVLCCELWFVFGMVIAKTSVDLKINTRIGMISGIALLGLFLALSIYIYVYISFAFLSINFFLSILACTAVVLIMISACRAGNQKKVFQYLAQYTMPIFLMHTIFAALARIIMLKLGIGSALIHTAVGLTISFAGPIVAAEVMKHIKWLDILLYPNKYIKLN